MELPACAEGGLPPLEEADVILIRHKRVTFRYFLRKLLRSYWDHVALVVFPKNAEANVEHTVLAEAVGGHGRGHTTHQRDTVALHRLDAYLSRPDLYEVGIRRVPNLTAEEKRRVVVYMIANVDAPYWPWKKTMVVLAAYSRMARDFVMRTQRYSCSSLVQRAFYDAFDWSARKRIVFKTDTVTPLILQELTTPGDLASTDKLTWIHNRH